MDFTTTCNKIFSQAIRDFHLEENLEKPINNPHEAGTIGHYLYQKNWIDTVQWHLEDIIRIPHIDPAEALAIKRRIDQSNQERTDIVELIDAYFGQQYANIEPSTDATINTESPAWALDRLSILHLKIYHMEQEAQRTDLSEADAAYCRERLSILLEQKRDLSEAFERLLADYGAGRKRMKEYKQMKMYNDPRFNPSLYQQ